MGTYSDCYIFLCRLKCDISPAEHAPTHKDRGRVCAHLTQLGDAYFLQVLPGDVGDELDVLVAVLHQHLVVLAQTNGRQPLSQAGLWEGQKHECPPGWSTMMLAACLRDRLGI